MTRPADDTDSVLLELERLRHSIDVGLTAIRGDLALLLQRTGQVETRLDELEGRVTKLESTRWPLPAIATLAALAAAVTGIAALVLR